VSDRKLFGAKCRPYIRHCRSAGRARLARAPFRCNHQPHAQPPRRLPVTLASPLLGVGFERLYITLWSSFCVVHSQSGFTFKLRFAIAAAAPPGASGSRSCRRALRGNALRFATRRDGI